MTDFDLDSVLKQLLERDRQVHSWMNKVHARLAELERRIGNGAAPSLNDLDCRIGALERK